MAKFLYVQFFHESNKYAQSERMQIETYEKSYDLSTNNVQ
jgi:hypothetical protein